MINRIMLAGVFGAAATCAAGAQTAEQRYQGTFYVLTAPACPDQVNREFTFVFRTQASKQLIGLYRTASAISLAPSTNGRFAASGSYAATKIGSGAGVTPINGAYSGFIVTPATFADTTLSVLVRGRLTNFDDVTGCTITFRAAGARRPDDF